MNAVDSSGWLAFFSGEQNADTFAKVIRDVNTLVVPSICVYEVFKRVLTQLGEEAALQTAGVMSRGLIANVTSEIAIEAARISVENKLAMADSMILTIARTHNAILWTQDTDFRGLEGVELVEKSFPEIR